MTKLWLESPYCKTYLMFNDIFDIMAKNKIEIIYSDDDILVVNKPSGISVTKDRSGLLDLRNALVKQDKSLEHLLLVHRLDKLTSGVMVLAKNRETQSRLASAFEKREVKKTYLTIVSGYASSLSGTVDMPISRDKKDGVKMRYDKRGKETITNWSVLADFGLYLLIKACPVTGRTHQIRLHMKSIGLPLAIDPLYGGTKPLMLSDIKLKYRKKKDVEERPLIDRLTLHAYQLELPGYDKPFVGKLDKYFAAAVKMLNKHSKQGEIENSAENIDKILNSGIFG